MWQRGGGGGGRGGSGTVSLLLRAVAGDADQEGVYGTGRSACLRSFCRGSPGGTRSEVELRGGPGRGAGGRGATTLIAHQCRRESTVEGRGQGGHGKGEAQL